MKELSNGTGLYKKRSTKWTQKDQFILHKDLDKQESNQFTTDFI